MFCAVQSLFKFTFVRFAGRVEFFIKCRLFDKQVVICHVGTRESITYIEAVKVKIVKIGQSKKQTQRRVTDRRRKDFGVVNTIFLRKTPSYPARLVAFDFPGGTLFDFKDPFAGYNIIGCGCINELPRVSLNLLNTSNMANSSSMAVIHSATC